MAIGHHWKWMIISSFLLTSWRCSNFGLRPSHASSQEGRPNQQPLTSSDETDENESDGSVSPPLSTPSAFVPYGRTVGTVLQPGLVRQEARTTSPTTDVGNSHEETEELFWQEQENGNADVDVSASCSQRDLDETEPGEGEIHQLSLKHMLTVLTRNMPPAIREENSALERLGAFFAQALIKHLASTSAPDASLAGILNREPPPSRAPPVGQCERPLPRRPVPARLTGETNAYQDPQSHAEGHLPSGRRSSRTKLPNDGSSNPFVTQKPPVPPRPSPKQKTPPNGGTSQMRGYNAVSSCPPDPQEELPPVPSRSISLLKALREPSGAALPELELPRAPSPCFRPPTPKDEKTTVPTVSPSSRCAESAPRAADRQPPPVPSPKFRPPTPKGEKSTVPTGSRSSSSAESALRTSEQPPPRVPSPQFRPPTPGKTTVRPTVGPEPCREEKGDKAVKPRSVREQARLLNQYHVQTGMVAFAKHYQMLGGLRTGNASPRVQLPQMYTDNTQEDEARAGKELFPQEANERRDDAPPPSERETADEKRPAPGNEGEGKVEEQREGGSSGKTESTAQSDQQGEGGEISRSETVPGQAPEEENVYEILHPIRPSTTAAAGLSVATRESPTLAVEPKHPDLATLLGYASKTTHPSDINPDVLAQVLEVLNSSQREQSAASPQPNGSSVNENGDLSSGAGGGDSRRRRHKFSLFGLLRGNNKSPSDKDSSTSSLQEAMGGDTAEKQSSREQQKKSPAGEGDRKRKLRQSWGPKFGNDGTAAAGVQQGGGNDIHDEGSTGDGNSSQEPTEPARSFEGSDFTVSSSVDRRDTSSSSREQPARSATDTVGNLEGTTKPNREGNGVPDITTSAIGYDLDKMADDAVEELMAVEGGGKPSQVTHHFTDQQSEDRGSDSEHTEPSSVPRASGSSSSSGDQREGHLRSSSSDDSTSSKAPERRPRQAGLLRRWFSKNKKTPDSAESEIPLLEDSATK